jgi:hypothetical protein
MIKPGWLSQIMAVGATDQLKLVPAAGVAGGGHAAKPGAMAGPDNEMMRPYEVIEASRSQSVG